MYTKIEKTSHEQAHETSKAHGYIDPRPLTSVFGNTYVSPPPTTLVSIKGGQRKTPCFHTSALVGLPGLLIEDRTNM